MSRPWTTLRLQDTTGRLEIAIDSVTDVNLDLGGVLQDPPLCDGFWLKGPTLAIKWLVGLRSYKSLLAARTGRSPARTGLDSSHSGAELQTRVTERPLSRAREKQWQNTTRSILSS